MKKQNSSNGIQHALRVNFQNIEKTTMDFSTILHISLGISNAIIRHTPCGEFEILNGDRNE